MRRFWTLFACLRAYLYVVVENFSERGKLGYCRWQHFESVEGLDNLGWMLVLNNWERDCCIIVCGGNWNGIEVYEDVVSGLLKGWLETFQGFDALVRDVLIACMSKGRKAPIVCVSNLRKAPETVQFVRCLDILEFFPATSRACLVWTKKACQRLHGPGTGKRPLSAGVRNHWSILPPHKTSFHV